MSRLGAKVVGIDASNKNVNIAKIHARKQLKIDYVCASPENFKTETKFDVILNMEIIEHVLILIIFLNQVQNY